jgi:hypothetical protein
VIATLLFLIHRSVDFGTTIVYKFSHVTRTAGLNPPAVQINFIGVRNMGSCQSGNFHIETVPAGVELKPTPSENRDISGCTLNIVFNNKDVIPADLLLKVALLYEKAVVVQAFVLSQYVSRGFDSSSPVPSVRGNHIEAPWTTAVHIPTADPNVLFFGKEPSRITFILQPVVKDDAATYIAYQSGSFTAGETITEAEYMQSIASGDNEAGVHLELTFKRLDTVIVLEEQPTDPSGTIFFTHLLSFNSFAMLFFGTSMYLLERICGCRMD